MVSGSSIGSAQEFSIARPASLDALLDFAWASAIFTATDAIDATGLTRSTAIGAIDSLVALGLLRELPNLRSTESYRLGRPARRFEFRADAGVLIGVDSGHERLTVALADLRGDEILAHHESFDLAESDPDVRRRQIAAAIDAALGEAQRAREDVLALCIGVPAPVNGAGRSPQHRAGFWQLMNPGFIDEFSTWVPMVRIENDAYLAAIAEGSHGDAVGCRDYVALLAGERLGAGVVVDGRALRGAHGGVGEMGAFTRVRGVESDGGLGHIAAKFAREAIARGEGGALAEVAPSELDGRAVMERAASGDRLALRVVEQLGGVLARIVSVLGNFYDPSRVIIAGAVPDGFEDVLTAARAELPATGEGRAPELVVSRLGGDVVATGAVAAALQAARTNALDVWLSRQAAS